MEPIPPGDAARLAAVPALAGAGDAVALTGGLTNRNYRLSTPDGPVVARLSDPAGGLLAIDREHEFANSSAAARSGAGPEVLGYDPAASVLVVRWIDGRTLADTDLADAVMLQRVAAGCRLLHGGERFGNDFDMVRIQAGYLQVVLDRGFRLPAGYRDVEPQIARIATALAVRPLPTVPCHNDLLAANLIDDGDRIWLIDYEYAGNNDPCFELGNIWSEAELAPELLDPLVAAYFGGPHPELVARARLQAVLAKYGWTLWATIQQAVSPIDFDFWSWGMAKYERALADLVDPRFDDWLDAVAAT